MWEEKLDSTEGVLFGMRLSSTQNRVANVPLQTPPRFGQFVMPTTIIKNWMSGGENSPNINDGDTLELSSRVPTIPSQVIQDEPSLELDDILSALSHQTKSMAWERQGSNLESRLNISENTYIVRLSRDQRTIQDYPIFDFQVFKVRPFLLPSTLLFNVKDMGHDLPVGQQLATIYNQIEKN